MSRVMSLFLAFLLGILFLAGSSFAGKMINGAGASFPYPVYSAWAWFYTQKTGIRVNYQSCGSGCGIRQISNRLVDFGASDNPLTPEELKKKGLLQFPTVIGGVVPIVNIPGIKKGQLVLDGEVIALIYLGKIKYWDDPKIKALNPGINLPHEEIVAIHRSDGSGTTAIFTHYLHTACKLWGKGLVGKAINWPVDDVGKGIGAKGNEGVANYVKRTPYSIGYVEFAYAIRNKLAYTKLRNPAGNVVEPSMESFSAAAASADLNPKKHFYVWMVNAPGKKAWPISGATFILLAKERTESNKKVVKFFDWAYKNGDEIAKRLYYVPLPTSVKDKIKAYWKKYGIY